MKIKFKLPRSLAILTLGLLPLAGLHAEVPETVHYQGRVTVGGEAFNGTGQFKFAVVDGGTENVSTATATANVNDGFVTSLTLVDGGNGYTTDPSVTLEGGSGTGAAATATVLNGRVTGFNMTLPLAGGYGSEAPTVVIAAPPPASIQTLWSNDGSSTSGSAPGTSVSLPVSGGVFSVILGDASLPGMTALPVATFASSPVRLRVWFDGGSGFELLAPDQPITSTPYAMRAASVAESAIGAAQIDSGFALWSSISGKVSILENVGIGTIDPLVPLHVVGSVISGFPENQATGQNSFVSGGYYFNQFGVVAVRPNSAPGDFSFVGGGGGNTSSGGSSFIGGGEDNTASGYNSFVGGGSDNTASGICSFVGGGGSNSASGHHSFAAGYRAKTVHHGAFVWADRTEADFSSTAQNQFLIRASGGVGIGVANPNAPLHVTGSVISGHSGNTAAGLNSFASGGTSSSGNSNVASGSTSFVGGGYGNSASSGSSFVGGGIFNQASNFTSFVGGGSSNTASGSYSFVAGGIGNTASALLSFAAGQQAKATHEGAFVWADNNFADFSSDRAKQFKIRANGGAEFHTGTWGMTVFSAWPGSTRAAVQAESTHADGIALVGRNDSTDATLVLNNRGTGPIIKAFNVGAVRMQLFNNGNLTISGALTQSSDKSLKQDVEKLGGVLGDVLSLQPTSYRMKDRGDESGRLYGFIAQEVREVFPAVVSEDAETGLLSLSYSDFSVLAIQAIKEQQEIIEAQARRIGALEKAASRSEQLEARLVALEQRKADEPVAAR